MGKGGITNRGKLHISLKMATIFGGREKKKIRIIPDEKKAAPQTMNK